MIEMFNRQYFGSAAKKALTYSPLQLMNLYAAGAPAFLVLLFSVRFNGQIVVSAMKSGSELDGLALLGLVFVNIVRLLAVAQCLLVWTSLGDLRMNRLSAGELVNASLRNCWRLVAPIIPVWLFLPYLMHPLAVLCFYISKAIAPAGLGWAVSSYVWLVLFSLPFLTVIAAKILFIPSFAVEMQRPSFFGPTISSFRFASLRALRCHWGAFFLLSLPAILGLLIPMTLLQDTLFFFAEKPQALKIQGLACFAWWLFGSVAISSAKRLYMDLGRAWEKEISRLAKKDKAK